MDAKTHSLPPDLPAWAARVDNPYLHGVHGPTVHETTATELAVAGELPADLYGAFVRNGCCHRDSV